MKKISVGKNDAGRRIDKVLSGKPLFRTRGEIAKGINAGDIRVNNKKVKPCYILKMGDKVGVNIQRKEKYLIPNSDVKFEIVFQDKNIIVINKPAGMKIHPVNFEEKNTLVNGLIARFPEIKKVGDGSFGSELRPGIVHRLDKDTSGIMVAARNNKTFRELKKLFQERKIKKEYVALLYGRLEKKKGEIIKPIARAGNYRKQTIAGAKTKTKIRPAVTGYEVMEELRDYSLVRAFPKTGRTHQIRIHFSFLGSPVIGDKLYYPKNLREKMPKIKRQLLHAQKINFDLFGKNFSFQADPPRDFRAFLKSVAKSKIKKRNN